MELPLVLRSLRDGSLSYGISPWYRLAMGLILALLLATIFVGESPPGLLGWIFIALAALALVYEERWDLDPGRGELRHRYGLLFAARRLSWPVPSIGSFRIAPYVRGSVPGSADERAENAKALAEGRGEAEKGGGFAKRRPIYKRAYLCLLCETGSESLLVNMVPARRGPRLREVGGRLATLCGVALEEG